MTPEQQRIAIAEACGINHGVLCAGTDYLNDLNAMHEAEKMVNEKWPTYCERLLKIVEPEPRSLEVCHYWNLLHATAAQRAEAFLKTLNLWK